MSALPGVLILTGPTASGKSAAALALAVEFDAEIIGADSRQIYRGMPVGTAAPSLQARRRVAHHLVDFLDPHERYSAAQFTIDALAALADIHARGKRAIVVGGTGFYVRALCGDVSLAPRGDGAVRARVVRESALHPADVLHGWLRTLDRARAAAIPAGDRYRIVRALEVALAARAEPVQPARLETLRTRNVPYCKAYLEVDRATLAQRIAQRVADMLANGLLEEAWRLGDGVVAADAVGYPQALAHMRGWSTENELRESLARATRRYAKRQETWFRSEPDLVRVRPEQAASTLASLARELPGWN